MYSYLCNLTLDKSLNAVIAEKSATKISNEVWLTHVDNEPVTVYAKLPPNWTKVEFFSGPYSGASSKREDQAQVELNLSRTTGGAKRSTRRQTTAFGFSAGPGANDECTFRYICASNLWRNWKPGYRLDRGQSMVGGGCTAHASVYKLFRRLSRSIPAR
jgi:hypothetical protein